MFTITIANRAAVTVIAIVLLASVLITNVFAAEIESQPISNTDYVQQLLQNTPSYGTLNSSWDYFIENIHWSDYVMDESVSATVDVYSTANFLMNENTPGMGDLNNHWDEFVASLNWMDYAAYDLPHFYKECIAC